MKLSLWVFYFQPKDLLKDKWDDLLEVKTLLNKNGKKFNSFYFLRGKGDTAYLYGAIDQMLLGLNVVSGVLDDHAWCCDDVKNFLDVVHLEDYLVFQCVKCNLVLCDQRRKEKIRTTIPQEGCFIVKGQNNILYMGCDDKIIELDCSNRRFKTIRRVSSIPIFPIFSYFSALIPIFFRF